MPDFESRPSSSGGVEYVKEKQGVVLRFRNLAKQSIDSYSRDVPEMGEDRQSEEGISC